MTSPAPNLTYTRIDRATRLLGWRPQYDITEGIRHSLQWAAIRAEILPDNAAGKLYCQLYTVRFPGNIGVIISYSNNAATTARRYPIPGRAHSNLLVC